MYYPGKHHRISPIELLVLNLLKEKPLYGNEIIIKLREEFGNTSFEARSGTIYPILKKFSKRSWIEEESDEQYKKKYKLTEEGQKVLENIVEDDVMDGFMAFFHKFTDYIFTDILGMKKTQRNIHRLQRDIKRLERRKEYLEKNLSKISEIIEKKKGKLKELEKDMEYFEIPIE